MPHEPIRLILSATAVAVALVFGWAALDLLLLVFAGLLVAQLLLGLVGLLRRSTGMPHGWALAAVCLALTGALILGALLLAPALSEQWSELVDSLPSSFEQARASLRGSSLGRWLGEAIPNPDVLKDMLARLAGGSGVVRRVTGLFSTAFGALVSAVLVAFLGLFFAAQPQVYRDGLVRLIPPERRLRAQEVLGRVGETLRWWILGKAISMTLVAALSGLGLWLLGVPLALALGLIAGLLGFIPNFGPVLAVVPAALVALSQSAASAGYVLLLYGGIQLAESYVLTPLVQQRTISLPPGLILGTQVVLGGLLGALGLALSTPMLAAAVVMIDMLYVQDVLHDEPGPRGAAR
ncbi:AI-2E family transporter [Nannocystis pusilla]|uniref:AI-2E family transporter n=1 Tax=Nannocystis pusilla TaxID=889268 RepID=A0ABS7U579_9BACT|nr:AI-2E family transporter [Nannocystis pusilla]MBZ5715707.1 AI-2E family transporter [Nannocystis pusilla]